MKSKLNSPESESFTRRKFIATTGTAAVGAFTIVNPLLVRGSVANNKIRIGIIGCGGRGTWIAKLFKNHGGFEVVAGADYFQDKVDAFGIQAGVPKNKLFTGLSAYKKLIDSGVDAIAIESPPYFHPEQAAAGVDAGVHVYLAKPAAVDVPGCNSIEESGLKASKNNLCFLIDFQTRANDFFIEALHRVHNGDIGELAFGEASYHAEFPFTEQNKILKSDPQNTENQLRAWGISRELSGDIITEQNIHTLDVMSWIMNAKPVSAYGSCGHNVRDDIGTCSDHFALVFKYPKNVAVTFSSRQYESSSAGGIKNRMFGSKGTMETEYGGQVRILGENTYQGGETGSIYQQGAETNIAAFYNNITSGNYTNITLFPGVTSNLVTILGRNAAYGNKEVLWEDLIQSKEKLIPNLKGLKI
ncbi:Gfo/Idh/MocA family oxidoreductase [Draconibacterium sp.]|jgi:predicted dehydrogenase